MCGLCQAGSKSQCFIMMTDNNTIPPCPWHCVMLSPRTELMPSAPLSLWVSQARMPPLTGAERPQTQWLKWDLPCRTLDNKQGARRMWWQVPHCERAVLCYTFGPQRYEIMNVQTLVLQGQVKGHMIPMLHRNSIFLGEIGPIINPPENIINQNHLWVFIV